MLTLVPGGVPGAHKGSAKVIFTIITINREKTLRKGDRGRTWRFLPSSSWASSHIWRGLIPVQSGIQTLEQGLVTLFTGGKPDTSGGLYMPVAGAPRH